MTYRQRLNYWAIAQLLPSQHWMIVARFHNRSDADGHYHFLRHSLPQMQFRLVFDLNESQPQLPLKQSHPQPQHSLAEQMHNN